MKLMSFFPFFFFLKKNLFSTLLSFLYKISTASVYFTLCEEMSLGGIKCPDGFGGIRFKSAHYGRQDIDTCPHPASSNLNCGYSVLDKFQGPWEGQVKAFNKTQKIDGNLKLKCILNKCNNLPALVPLLSR